MKHFTVKISLALCAASLIFAGCSLFSSTQAPPSGIETSLFNIETNVTPGSNVVVLIQSTNAAGVPVATPVTNVVPATTNYVFLSPSAAASAAVQTAQTVASATGTPWAGLIGAALSGILAIWGTMRNKQANTATALAANTAQILQVARNVISAAPNGASIMAQFNNWMLLHQQDANLANEVAGLVDSYVDPNDMALSGVATQIISTAGVPVVASPAVTVAVAPTAAALS